jgi:hypothetical protein
MKKIVTLFFAGALMSALCVGFLACNKPEKPEDPETQGENVPFSVYSPEDIPLGEEFSVRWMNLDYDEESKILAINSDEELQNYIEGEYSSIDFSNKTLIVAYEKFDIGHVLHPDKLSFAHIEGQDYVMTVNVPPFVGAVLSEWLVAIIVDKIDDDSKVALKVTNQNLSEL